MPCISSSKPKKCQVFHFNDDLPYINLNTKNFEYTFLVDTGAALSVFKEEFIKNYQELNEDQTVEITGISGKPFQTKGELNLKFNIKGTKFSHKFQVFPTGTCNLESSISGILGADFFEKFKAVINFENAEVEIKLKRRNLCLKLFKFDEVLYQSLNSNTINYVHVYTAHENEIYIPEIKIADNVICLSNIQKPSIYGQITLVIENSRPHDFEIKNFKPKYIPIQNVSIFNEDSTEKIMKRINFMSKVSVKLAEQGRTEEISKLLKIDELPSTEKNVLANIIKDYSKTFALKGDKISELKGWDQELFLKPNVMPKYVKQYRLPPIHRRIIRDKVREMLANDIVEPSISPWNTPCLVVDKKGASSIEEGRLVMDYRKLNDVLEDDKFPIASINEILDGMKGARVYSTLDLNQGYFQVGLKKWCRGITAFSTSDGHFQMKKLPMGIKTAPAIFSRIMQTILQSLIGKICFVYLDDIIIYSKDMETHEKDIRTVLSKLEEVGLTVKPQKCKFFQKEVSYLGYIISEEGLKPDPSKFQVILDWPTPSNSKEVQSFLGLVGYFRRFIKDYAKIAVPLTRLTRKDTKFDWTEECAQAFEEMKRLVTNPPLLAYPDFDTKFILQTDASDYAIGAVLLNQDRKPIHFISRILKGYEINYHITDKELLAIVWAVKHLNNYLFGQKFTVETDHKALEYLYKCVDPSSRLTRFRLKLEEYNFDIKHVRGSKNSVADALSRIKFKIDINCLKKLHCNVTTRLQAKKAMLKEKYEKRKTEQETKPEERTKKQIITELLKMNKELPLLKFIVNFKDIRSKASDLYTINDENDVWYHEKHEILYVKIPKLCHRQTKVSFERAFEATRKNFCETVKQFKIKKIAILQNELEKIKPVRSRDIFKFLNATREEENKNEFYILKNVKPIFDKEEQNYILKTFHHSKLGGHFGIQKTFQKLRKLYYWSNLRKDVEKMVKNCKECQLNKHTRIRKTPMSITDTAEKGFDKVFIDIVGPLSETDLGHRYVLTVQDDLTKFLIATPLKQKSANEVAKAMVEEVFLKYLCPKLVVSDQGREFMNEVFQKVCEILQINQKFSTPYRHETIGALENSHKTLNNYLRIFTNDLENWDLELPYYTYAYNSTPHLATNYSPFSLIFGRENQIPNEEISDLGPVYDLELYHNELQARLKYALEDARKRQIDLKNKRKEEYDRRFETQTKDLEIGDFILLKNEGSKMDQVYEGPYEVLNKIGKNIMIDKNGKNKLVHSDNVKKYYELFTFWISNYIKL